MKIHIIMHESFEGPGAITTWAKQKNHELSFTKLHLHESLPTELHFDFLIVMGGPQNPQTTKQECPHFDAAREINFIALCMEQEKRVLGICLGAQLIGEALGARYEHSPHREIGVFPITLTEDGKKDPLVGSFPETFLVGHWHGDMPGLTPEAQVLAFSQGCPRQIVRYAPGIYGFQCHFELTPQNIEDLIQNSTQELEDYHGQPFVHNPGELRNQDCTSFNQLLFDFLDGLTG